MISPNATPAPAPTLTIDDVGVDAGGRTIVDDISLALGHGEVVGLMGPNGCGKSTILRTVYRALRPARGAILVDDADLDSMPFRDSARRVAALSQQSTSDFDFTVEETVAMGRIPHSGGGRLSARERELCVRTMADLHIGHLRHRGMTGLSGGERQRVLIARALVQEPDFLVLDEPTNHLDLAHQVTLLGLLRELEVGVLVILHDFNLAAAACDHLHFMTSGRIVASGSPAQLITPEMVRDVFGVDVAVVAHPHSGVPQVLPSIPSR